MCGIVGMLGTRAQESELVARLSAMSARILHRGPDDRGTFVDLAGDCGLAHTRLSILDLSAAAHQPMHSADGRFTVVFNGEIYNFRTLRDELERGGAQFATTSDTEVILKLYERHGSACVKQLEGMFALAIWDRKAQQCLLARDPLGVKPLYLWRVGGALAFASEVRSLLAAALATPRIDEAGLRDYLLFGSVQEPSTLIADISSLPAGTTLTWKAGECRIEPYWQLEFGSKSVDPREAIERTRAALDDTVTRHFVSDVPVGILLSGGIDSTALVALARANGFESLDTFCIAFEEHQFDEGAIARRTAKHFQTRHHECMLDKKVSASLLEQYLGALDLPSCDGFNTFCATHFAREAGTKVLLSGLGSDELFSGYPTFSRLPRLLALSERTKWLTPFRGAIKAAGGVLPSARFQRLASYATAPGSVAAAYWGVRGIFGAEECSSLVASYTGQERARATAPSFDSGAQPTVLDTVSYLEINRYMRNQLLRDSDVFSMANGVELRVPFVDSKLYESVCQLPADIRLQPRKQLLIDAVGDIPSWVISQPKRGFSFPLEQWFKELHQLDRWSPVKLRTWYRRWTLLTLNSFLAANRIDGIAEIPASALVCGAGPRNGSLPNR